VNPFFGPGLDDHFQRFDKTVAALSLRNSKAGKMGGNGPAANPEFHPAIAEYVQSRDLFCHAYRMRKRQQNDRDAKAQRASSFRQRSEQQQRRRSNRKVGVEVLLDGPHRLKSERLGVDRLLERIPVALDRRLRTVTRQLIVEAEFHASLAFLSAAPATG
jgi:hypothetical protein